jgi:hypothetical protein
LALKERSNVGSLLIFILEFRTHVCRVVLRVTVDFETQIDEGDEKIEELHSRIIDLKKGEDGAPVSQNNPKRKRRHSGGEMQERSKKVKKEKVGDGTTPDEDDHEMGLDSDDTEIDVTADVPGSIYSDSSEEGDANGMDDDGGTIESLEKDVEELQQRKQRLNQLLMEALKGQKDVTDNLTILKEQLRSAKRQKNAFCSLKRSEVRCVVYCETNSN